MQYLKRYQMSLNPKMIGNAWSSEDDKGLKAAVEKWGEGNWNKIASELKGAFDPAPQKSTAPPLFIFPHMHR